MKEALFQLSAPHAMYIVPSRGLGIVKSRPNQITFRLIISQQCLGHKRLDMTPCAHSVPLPWWRPADAVLHCILGSSTWLAARPAPPHVGQLIHLPYADCCKVWGLGQRERTINHFINMSNRDVGIPSLLLLLLCPQLCHVISSPALEAQKAALLKSFGLDKEPVIEVRPPVPAFMKGLYQAYDHLGQDNPDLGGQDIQVKPAVIGKSWAPFY